MKGVGLAVLVAVLALAVVALPLAGASSPTDDHGGTAAVFISTNSATANQVVAYETGHAGTLTWVGNFATGGTGTGAALGDSGALALTSDNQWLLSVDAGSNQISVFQVNTGFHTPLLTLTDVAASGGVLPVSLTISGNAVYVLNDGNTVTPGNIAGFTLGSHGRLHPITGSTQSLSTSMPTGAAQISFSPTGHFLVVTEKGTNLLDVYAVNNHGVASGPTSYASSGLTPYGFAFAGKHHLIVSEAHEPAVSSYSLTRSSGLQVVSASISDEQGAPCWVVVTENQQTAYISNTASDSISSFAVSTGGSLTLLQSVAAMTNAGPADSAIGGGGHFLYVVAGGAGEIEAYQIHHDTSLSWIQTVGGLPAGAEGLVAT
ncbi:MAG: beta-propeller fold lactonase family protein [Thermoplasmata archaeon]